MKLPLLALAALLAGCAQLETLPDGAPIPRDTGRALAFGRVSIADEFMTLVPPPASIVERLHWVDAPTVQLHLFRVEDGQKWLAVPYDGDDGRFEWLLPEGSYVVLRVAGGVVLSNEGLAAFQVPAGARAVALGTLALSIRWEPAGDWQPPRYEIADVQMLADERGWAELVARHPADGASPTGGSAFTDDALRSLFDDYSKSRVAAIFAAHGLSCETR